MPRDCHAYRDAISALSDGEALGMPRVELEAHLATCPDCADFEHALAMVNRRVIAPVVDVPDLTAGIMAAIADERAEPAAAGRWTQLRVVLGLIGLAQVLTAVPVLLGLHAANLHASRELGAFELALGVGLLVAARRPSRAIGLVPMVAVVAGLSVIGAVLDLVSGTTSVMAELPHLLEIGGVTLLALLARSTDREGRPLPGAGVIA